MTITTSIPTMVSGDIRDYNHAGAGEELAERVHIGGDPGHQVAGASLIVEGKGAAGSDARRQRPGNAEHNALSGVGRKVQVHEVHQALH